MLIPCLPPLQRLSLLCIPQAALITALLKHYRHCKHSFCLLDILKMIKLVIEICRFRPFCGDSESIWFVMENAGSLLCPFKRIGSLLALQEHYYMY